MRKGVTMYTIKVTNKVTGRIYEHKQVPMAHVEHIRLNPNLYVEIIEVSLRKYKR